MTPRHVLRVPYPPSANRLWRVYRGRAVKSPAARDYQRTVAMTARAAGWRPLEGLVVVEVDVYRPRAIGDLDNSLKALLDALRGVAYADDSQVAVIVASRWDDRSNPRAEVAVYPLDEVARG